MSVSQRLLQEIKSTPTQRCIICTNEVTSASIKFEGDKWCRQNIWEKLDRVLGWEGILKLRNIIKLPAKLCYSCFKRLKDSSKIIDSFERAIEKQSAALKIDSRIPPYKYNPVEEDISTTETTTEVIMQDEKNDTNELLENIKHCKICAHPKDICIIDVNDICAEKIELLTSVLDAVPQKSVALCNKCIGDLDTYAKYTKGQQRVLKHLHSKHSEVNPSTEIPDTDIVVKSMNDNGTVEDGKNQKPIPSVPKTLNHVQCFLCHRTSKMKQRRPVSVTYALDSPESLAADIPNGLARLVGVDCLDALKYCEDNSAPMCGGCFKGIRDDLMTQNRIMENIKKYSNFTDDSIKELKAKHLKIKSWGSYFSKPRQERCKRKYIPDLSPDDIEEPERFVASKAAQTTFPKETKTPKVIRKPKRQGDQAVSTNVDTDTDIEVEDSETNPADIRSLFEHHSFMEDRDLARHIHSDALVRTIRRKEYNKMCDYLLVNKFTYKTIVLKLMVRLNEEVKRLVRPNKSNSTLLRKDFSEIKDLDLFQELFTEMMERTPLLADVIMTVSRGYQPVEDRHLVEIGLVYSILAHIRNHHLTSMQKFFANALNEIDASRLVVDLLNEFGLCPSSVSKLDDSYLIHKRKMRKSSHHVSSTSTVQSTSEEPAAVEETALENIKEERKYDIESSEEQAAVDETVLEEKEFDVESTKAIQSITVDTTTDSHLEQKESLPDL
ncbi:unnamed protein product [Owenia fusiformis]|uniref:Uncharacterized protein n=1 Tax=Owenia fusiformis TaxID=6347 RepID=A0A8J1UFT1_OWEFU|nr:unnamed protein product [Owenia fusiformis]